MSVSLELRRRIMSLQKGALRDDYITNGLVLWMDGYDKGPDDTAWIDKVDGYEFINNNGSTGRATFGTNYVELDGVSQYLYNYNTYTPPGSASGTIEVVFETSDVTYGQIIFMPRNGATRVTYYFNSSGRIFLAGGSSTSRVTYNGTITANTKISSSISTARGYLNGTTMTTNSNSYMGGAVNNYNYIGKRRADSSTDDHNFFKGKIYSVRIYSRQLSAEEVAHNYEVDRARFKF